MRRSPLHTMLVAAVVLVSVGGAWREAQAQPDIPLMRARTRGLQRVAIAVQVDAPRPAARASVQAAALEAALERTVVAQGAEAVSRFRADLATLLVTVYVTCRDPAPGCAVVMLYSRLRPGAAGARENDESVVWLHSPAYITAPTWTAVAQRVQGYTSEGALVAGRLVAPPRR